MLLCHRVERDSVTPEGQSFNLVSHAGYELVNDADK